jgi:apolipoprotein D and lipocalin family protein
VYRVNVTCFRVLRDLSICLGLGLLVMPASVAADVKSVARVDVPRYLGTWFEVARYANWFQASCVGDVTATYEALEGGALKVINRCRESQGRISVAEGVAVPASGDTSGARLKVNFLPDWLRWFPWGSGDYWVVMLDTDYRWAVVSEPGRDYLWVLSRTPRLEPAVYDGIVEQLRRDGFDVDKLYPTLQTARPE